MTTYAIRHPDHGKAHREQWRDGPHTVAVWCGESLHVCLAPFCSAQRVPLADVPPADLCKRCWPGRCVKCGLPSSRAAHNPDRTCLGCSPDEVRWGPHDDEADR